MESREIVVQLRMAWWFKCYMAGLVFMLRVTGAEPNWDRIDYWVRKAIVMDRIK